MRRLLRFFAPLALAVLASCGGPGLESSTGEDLGSASLHVRVMAGNLTSGNLQSYDPGNGIRLFQGVQPDVVMLQEFNYGSSSDADIRAFVDRTFGASFSVTREGALQIPNGVISRWPIAASGRWTDPSVSNRGFAWARIALPNVSHSLWAVSVHLLTSGTAQRSTEATNLVALVRQNVPAGDYVVVGGDFNTGVRTEPAVVTFGQLFDVAAPYPADQNGNENTSSARSKPYDWVLASTNLRPFQTSTVIGSSTYPGGLVLDSRVYSPIAEILPATAADSGSSNMQHMGIVKDFLIPTTGTTPPPHVVTIVTPNGGETWAAGTSQTLRWTGNAGPVKVDLSLDGGATWTPVASSAAGSSLSWTVPASASIRARIRVAEVTDTSFNDSSNGDFAIAVVAPPAGDAFEPDDSASAARQILVNGAAQSHDIAPATDQDWATFTLAAAANIRVATDGPSGGDTYVYLYNAAQQLVGSDDDSGPGYYSLLSKPGLAAGTYYVKVTSYNSASVIRGYSLSVKTY